MDKIFRKLLTRNIKDNLKQFISVIVIVFLCTMLLSGFIVNSNTLNKSVDRYFDETRLADLWVYTDKVTSEDEKFYEDNGFNYDKRLYLETTSEIANNTKSNTKVYVSKGKISTPYIEKGIKGCLIDKNVWENSGAIVGIDKFKFEFDYLGNKIELEFRITGTMSLDECADTYSCCPVFIDENVFLKELNLKIYNLGVQIEEIPYNQILVKTENTESAKNKINNYYENSSTNLLFISDRSSIESVALLDMEVQQSKKMILVFPVIFLLVSVLVIITTIDQLIFMERSKIGTLKSVGVNDKKILRHYSSYGAVLCGIGALLGLIIGPLIIPGIMFIKYDLVYSIPKEYVKLSYPWWLLAVFVFMVLVGYLVAFITSHKILKKKPIECLKPAVNIKFKKTANNYAKKLPIPLKMAFRNIKVKPFRTIMATIGIAGCTALLLCGFGISDTLNFSTKNDLYDVFKYDVSSTYISADFKDKMESVKGVKEYEYYSNTYAQLSHGDKNKSANFYQIAEGSKLTDIKLSKGEACLSKNIAKELGVKVGDKIEVSSLGKKVQVKITSLCTTSLINGLFVAEDYGISSAITTYGVWVKTDKPNEVKTELNKINGTMEASTKEDMQAGVDNKISSITLITITLKVFAISLAIVVLLNIIFLVLKERAREVATLKVLGISFSNILLSLIIELLFMTIIGSAIGMALGYPILVLVLSINRVEVMSFLYHIYPLSFVLTFLINIATLAIVSSLSIFTIRKVNMIESLKSVE